MTKKKKKKSGWTRICIRPNICVHILIYILKDPPQKSLELSHLSSSTSFMCSHLLNVSVLFYTVFLASNTHKSLPHCGYPWPERPGPEKEGKALWRLTFPDHHFVRTCPAGGKKRLLFPTILLNQCLSTCWYNVMIKGSNPLPHLLNSPNTLKKTS